MALARRPASLLEPIFGQAKHARPACRQFSTHRPRCSFLGLDIIPERNLEIRQSLREAHNAPKLYPSPPSARRICKDPIGTVTATQLSVLDPQGARARLFSRDNLEAAKVGDILLVRLRNGDPFAGVCLNIRRQGIDSAILLRNQLTRVGVEMWYKIYSPNVEGIEVVQRRAKRARRARLYYLRKPEHDVGSVQNVVTQYIRQRQVLRSGGGAKGRDANAGKKKQKGKK